ncbi:hypothetical protein [Magnetococcus sp. PR-3]|uniref:hypothetical protein n=1 Tax=Magnetococcus sp. PR-3 TaxID=3120355 RepID=UPI002FCE66CE
MEMLPARLSKPEARTEAISMIYKDQVLELPMGDLYQGLLKHTDLAKGLHTLLAWLNSWMPVQMVAYWNPRLGPFLMACQESPPLSTALTQTVEQVMHGPDPRMRHWRHQELNYHLWGGTPLPTMGRLLLVEAHGDITIEDTNRLLKTIGEALDRTYINP